MILHQCCRAVFTLSIGVLGAKSLPTDLFIMTIRVGFAKGPKDWEKSGIAHYEVDLRTTQTQDCSSFDKYLCLLHQKREFKFCPLNMTTNKGLLQISSLQLLWFSMFVHHESFSNIMKSLVSEFWNLFCIQCDSLRSHYYKNFFSS